MHLQTVFQRWTIKRRGNSDWPTKSGNEDSDRPRIASSVLGRIYPRWIRVSVAGCRVDDKTLFYNLDRGEGIPDLLLLLHSAGSCSMAGRRRTGRLPDLLQLLCSAGPCSPAGWRRTDVLPDILLLLRSACPCGPVGRRQTDGLTDLLLVQSPAGPWGLAGPRHRDGQTEYHTCSA